ncbi:DMT family transporter [Nocardia panacis]|uniref:DMT family transporter n=1 Tax=Nocardia panacis TaxID=2340916 RepID=A0A3A4KIP0_9NOCA|nr:DMT family transporter [Nocardia panacis]RJO74722.1 DMT family transporter [Nocardia panacis]
MRLDRATWLLASVSLVWGASYTVTGWGLRELDVLRYNAIRFAFAAPLLLALVLLRERRGSIGIARRWWPRLVLSAAVGIVAYQLTFSAAVALTTVTESAILIALSPFCTALFAMLTGEPVRRTVLVSAVIAMVGVVLVVVGRGTGGVAHNRPLGDLAAVAAALLWGAYPVITRPMLGAYSPLRVTAWASLLGTAFLVPISLALSPLLQTERHTGLSALTAWSLAFSVLAVTIYGLVAWYWGVQRVGSTQTMVFMFAVPVAASAFAVLAGAEHITALQVIGGAIVLSALAFSRFKFGSGSVGQREAASPQSRTTPIRPKRTRPRRSISGFR